MSIVRYDPFRDLRTLQEEVNRLFSTNLSRSFGDEGIGRGAWSPSVDIYENKDQIVLEAELPNEAGDFDLTVENNIDHTPRRTQVRKTEESDTIIGLGAYGSFTVFHIAQTCFRGRRSVEYVTASLMTLPKLKKQIAS